MDSLTRIRVKPILRQRFFVAVAGTPHAMFVAPQFSGDFVVPIEIKSLEKL
jgi:hypothetical protein